MKRKRDYLFILLISLAVFSVCMFLTAKSSGGSESSIKIVVQNTCEETETEYSGIHTEKTEAAEASEAAEETTPEATTGFLYIDINRADAAELTQLEGIGEKLAERIAEYREMNGGFRNIEEIMLVSGIGKEKFAAIKEHIYVENPVYHSEEITESGSISQEITTENKEETIITESETAEEITEDVTGASGTKITLEDIAPIDLNTATAEELMLLPYVDEAAAEAIIGLRKDLDGFRNPYELLYVEELEQKEVAEIVNFVTIGQ